MSDARYHQLAPNCTAAQFLLTERPGIIRLLIMSGRLMELVSHAHLAWKRRVARDLLPHGVNPKQIYLLRKLRETGSLAPSRIADLVFADRPTVTSMLDTLERAGWIERRRDPEDGKRVLVDITDAGRRKLASVPEHLWRSGRTRFDPEAGLTARERETLVRLLEKLNAWLEQAAGDAPASAGGRKEDVEP